MECAGRIVTFSDAQGITHSPARATLHRTPLRFILPKGKKKIINEGAKEPEAEYPVEKREVSGR